MLSFRSSGSSKECMVMGGWVGGGCRQWGAPKLVFRQEPGGGQELDCDTVASSFSDCTHGSRQGREAWMCGRMSTVSLGRGTL